MTNNDDIKKLFQEAKEFEEKAKYSKAIKIYKRILKLDPDNQQVIKNLGLCYNANIEFDRSIEWLLKVKDLENQGFTIWHVIGDSYRNLKEFRKAIDAYKKALEFDSDEIIRDVVISKIDTLVLKADYSSEEL